ncbi:class I SAM-dependent methyltransferase [Lentibacillus lipolyticus]|nr:class I SAM-dependent methyltransferase [Lentibacillus lipolyticus]
MAFFVRNNILTAYKPPECLWIWCKVPGTKTIPKIQSAWHPNNKGDFPMDTISFFEQKLQSNQEPIETVEQNWDQKAEMFYRNQVTGSTYYNRAVPRLLEQKGIVTPSSTLLDIGAGSGRYAIPFAQICQSVHALDLSSEMLRYMQQEIEKHNLTNIHMTKSAWPTAEEIGEFDIAFAAMCPATRSIEALREMSKTASKYGVICQFTASTDRVMEALKEHYVIDTDPKGPHHNRNILQAYFNILWELGYEPEISYLRDTFEVHMTITEAVDTYRKRYDQAEAEQIRKVINTIQQDGMINNRKYTTLAVISWETRGRGDK